MLLLQKKKHWNVLRSIGSNNRSQFNHFFFRLLSVKSMKKKTIGEKKNKKNWEEKICSTNICNKLFFFFFFIFFFFFFLSSFLSKMTNCIQQQQRKPNKPFKFPPSFFFFISCLSFCISQLSSIVVQLFQILCSNFDLLDFFLPQKRQ